MYVVLAHVDECLYKKYMQWSHNAYRNYKQMYIDIPTSKIQFVWCYTISVGVCGRTLLHRGLDYYKKVPYLITSAWPNCTKQAHMCSDCVTVHGKTQSYTAKVNMLPDPLYYNCISTPGIVAAFVIICIFIMFWMTAENKIFSQVFDDTFHFVKIIIMLLLTN